MASLKRLKHNAKGTVTTTDGTTWTTLATYTLSSNAAFGIRVNVVGKDGSGNPSYISGFDAGSRVSGTLSLISGAAGLVGGQNIATTLSTATARINSSGDDIQIQVKGVAATTIEWMGYLEIDIH